MSSVFLACPSGAILFFYNSHMPTYFDNKYMEFNFLMLQLLKLNKINHCQCYKSHFNCFYIARCSVAGGQNIQLSLPIPYCV